MHARVEVCDESVKQGSVCAGALNAVPQLRYHLPSITIGSHTQQRQILRESESYIPWLAGTHLRSKSGPRPGSAIEFLDVSQLPKQACALGARCCVWHPPHSITVVQLGLSVSRLSIRGVP